MNNGFPVSMSDGGMASIPAFSSEFDAALYSADGFIWSASEVSKVLLRDRSLSNPVNSGRCRVCGGYSPLARKSAGMADLFVTTISKPAAHADVSTKIESAAPRRVLH